MCAGLHLQPIYEFLSLHGWHVDILQSKERHPASCGLSLHRKILSVHSLYFLMLETTLETDMRSFLELTINQGYLNPATRCAGLRKKGETVRLPAHRWNFKTCPGYEPCGFLRGFCIKRVSYSLLISPTLL